MTLAVVAAVLLAQTVVPAQAPGASENPPAVKILPVDESGSDPGFAKFRDELIEAAQKRDIAFLRSAIAPAVAMGFETGPASLEEVLAAFQRTDREEDLWEELRDVLLLGATREGGGFCAPYVATKYPRNLYPEYLVVTVNRLRVRRQPNVQAPVIATLSYELVKPLYDFDLPYEEGKREKNRWVKIRTSSGIEGHVCGKYVRHPHGYRACFEKINGQWKLVSFVAGD